MHPFYYIYWFLLLYAKGISNIALNALDNTESLATQKVFQKLPYLPQTLFRQNDSCEIIALNALKRNPTSTHVQSFFLHLQILNHVISITFNGSMTTDSEFLIESR